MQKSKITIILLAIVILGTFLRFYKLGNNSFSADEFLDINATYGRHQLGAWKAWDFNLGEAAERENDASDARAWIYRSQVAALFNFLPPTETASRSTSAAWGVLTILIMYFVAVQFTKNKLIGLLSAFIFAISINGIEFDRTLRMYAMFFPVFLLFSWTVFNFLEKKYDGNNNLIKNTSNKFRLNLIYLIPSVLFGIISILLHQLAANIVIIVALYFVFWGIIGFRKNDHFNKYIVYLASLVIIFFLGFLLFPQEVKKYTGGLQFFNDNWSYVSRIFVDYASAIPALILIFLGSYFLWKKGNQKESAWLTVSFWGILLSAILLWRRNVGDQYIFFAQSFKIILLSAGIYYSALFFKENMQNRKNVFAVVLLVLLLAIPNYGYFFERDNTYNQTSTSDNPDYRKVFVYFKKHKNDDDVLVTRNFRNYYWSGTKTKTYSFGGELAKEKLSLEELEKIIKNHPHGWLIYSDNDESYISNDVEVYARRNMEKVSNSFVRGKISVYRWGES